MSVNGVEVARYAYDARGLRTRKQLTNPRPGQPAVVLYRYDAEDRLLEEVAGSAASAPGINVVAGQSLVTHVWQGEVLVAQVLAAHSPGNEGHAAERVLWLHTDHLGTPRAASDEAGRVVWRWEGEAFGASLAQEDPDGDGQRTGVNVRFAGQYYDAESGLHYNGQRYYDGQSGRYVQSDPIGLEGGINTYAYVFGNPLSYVDPEGLAGHHLVPQTIWRNEPLRPETARVFDRATTGPIPGGHNFGDGHSAYNKAVQEMWDKAKAGGMNCQSMTPNQAEDFVRQVRRSQDPRIRDFNHRIYRRIINGAFRSVPYRGGPD